MSAALAEFFCARNLDSNRRETSRLYITHYY